MKFLRVASAGLVVATLVVIAASFSAAQPAGPAANPTPASNLTPAPNLTPAANAAPRAVPVPTPTFLFGAPTPPSIIPSIPPTLPPANQPTTLPYPAYGSPAPGATALVAQPGVPQIVTLQQAVAIGFARSPALAAARGDYVVAHAPVVASRLAFFPAITGTGTTAHENRQVNAATAGGASANFPTVTSNGLSVSLRQLIWDGGNLWAQLQSAKANQAASIDSFRRQAQTVANNVGQAYYAALAAQRTTAAAVASLRNAEAQVALVQAQIRAGTAAASAAASLEFQAAQARATLVTDQGNELSALSSFANTLGLSPDVNVQPQDDVPANPTSSISTIPLPSYDQAIVRALALRPDFDQAQRTLDSAKYTLKAAYLGYAPSLTGDASWGTASTDLVGGTYRNSNSIGLTLTIPVPFFDQGVNEGKILQAKGNVDIAVANLNTTKLGIELNVRQALVTLISAKSRLDVVQAEYTSAITALQATQAQYKVGVAAITDLINAQNQYTSALVDEVNAAYSLRQSEQSYLFATGEITSLQGP